MKEVAEFVVDMRHSRTKDTAEGGEFVKMSDDVWECLRMANIPIFQYYSMLTENITSYLMISE